MSQVNLNDNQISNEKCSFPTKCNYSLDDQSNRQQLGEAVGHENVTSAANDKESVNDEYASPTNCNDSPDDQSTIQKLGEDVEHENVTSTANDKEIVNEESASPTKCNDSVDDNGAIQKLDEDVDDENVTSATNDKESLNDESTSPTKSNDLLDKQSTIQKLDEAVEYENVTSATNDKDSSNDASGSPTKCNDSLDDQGNMQKPDEALTQENVTSAADACGHLYVEKNPEVKCLTTLPEEQFQVTFNDRDPPKVQFESQETNVDVGDDLGVELKSDLVVILERCESTNGKKKHHSAEGTNLESIYCHDVKRENDQEVRSITTLDERQTRVTLNDQDHLKRHLLSHEANKDIEIGLGIDLNPGVVVTEKNVDSTKGKKRHNSDQDTNPPSTCNGGNEKNDQQVKWQGTLRAEQDEKAENMVQSTADEGSSSKVCCYLVQCLGICGCIVYLTNFFSRFGGDAFHILEIILYVFDVISDAISGIYFIQGEEIDKTKFGVENFTTYTVEVCNNFETYSHPIWGSLAIGITWAPGVVEIANLFKVKAELKEKTTAKERQISLKKGTESKRGIFKAICSFLFWPIVGFRRMLNREEAERTKVFEALLESTFQLQLQIFVIYFGVRPGVIQTLSITASFMTIVFNVCIFNEIGRSKNTCAMVVAIIKAMPIFAISTLFRSVSFVTMLVFLRWYSVIPLMCVYAIQHIMRAKLLTLGNSRVPFYPAAIPNFVTGPVVNLNHKQLYKFHHYLCWEAGMLAIYCLTLGTISIMWEKTDLLKQNLHTCAFPLVKENVSTICGSLVGIGLVQYILIALGGNRVLWKLHDNVPD